VIGVFIGDDGAAGFTEMQQISSDQSIVTQLRAFNCTELVSKVLTLAEATRTVPVHAEGNLFTVLLFLL